MIDLKDYKKAYVMAPEMRALDIIYFSDLLFNFNYIDFKFNQNKNISKLVLIDQTFIKNIKYINKNQDYKFVIFIWNGSFDLDKFKKDIEEIKNLKINYKLFVIGSFHNPDKNFLYPSDLKIKILDRRINIKNLNKNIKKIYLNYKTYSKFRMLKHPITAIRKLFFPKVIFYGFGLIRKIEILNNEQNNKSDNFNNIKNYYWKKLFSYENDNKVIKKSIDLFESVLDDQIFNNLNNYEKYYILQSFFRHIFIKICSNFKNFEWERYENKLNVYHSPYYTKNYFIDFGSKCDTGTIYSRFLFLKRFNKKILNINFFKNISKADSIKINIHESRKYLEKVYSFSIKNKNISGKKLYELLKIKYNKLK
tara:strand:- start:3206 stop:4300 length:1095 start_codon:yes stop_codon:yes gene_type:complete